MESNNNLESFDAMSSALDLIQAEGSIGAKEAAEASGTPEVCSQGGEGVAEVDRDDIVSGAPGDSSSTKEPRVFKRMSGAARKRFRRLMGDGVAKEQALSLARKPWVDIAVEKPAKEKGPVKRVRSEDESPQGSAKKAPKLRAETSGEPRQPSFREVAGSSRVGIRNSDPMSEDQMKLVHRHLNLAMVTQWANAKGGAPQFLGFIHKTGWILVTCVNQASRDWLVNEVPNLKPWPEAKLSVIPEGELPKPATAITFIPESEAASVEEALALIRVQNFGLNTELWKVLGEKAEQGGKVVTFALDEPSAETLKANRGEVAIGFKKVLFRLKGGPNAPPAQQTEQQPQPLAESTPGPSTMVPSGRTPIPQGSRGRGGGQPAARGTRGMTRGMVPGRARPITSVTGGPQRTPVARGRGGPQRVTKRAK
ncbi:uncharacterized protein LOC134795557 [Cydia splendana]|uniref:uncharacterized protein LOC134795557 n=1 Tax=Cydia splendana TaxID=1100963 RepID=UPI00300C3CDA